MGVRAHPISPAMSPFDERIQLPIWL